MNAGEKLQKTVIDERADTLMETQTDITIPSYVAFKDGRIK